MSCLPGEAFREDPGLPGTATTNIAKETIASFQTALRPTIRAPEISRYRPLPEIPIGHIV